MRNISKALAAVGLAAGSMAVLAVGAPAAQAGEATSKPAAAVAGGEIEGCPYGAVCIYPRDKGWNNGRPSNVYWSYGSHKLYNQLGYHYVLNNQSGGAGVWLCKGSNGTTCVDHIAAGWVGNKNLTPINSVKLVR